MTAPAVTPGRLTEHQATILHLTAQGLTAAQIARRIGRHHDTVRSHLANAYAALGANNAAHAVALALGAGLIPPPAISGSQPQRAPEETTP